MSIWDGDIEAKTLQLDLFTCFLAGTVARPYTRCKWAAPGYLRITRFMARIIHEGLSEDRKGTVLTVPFQSSKSRS